MLQNNDAIHDNKTNAARLLIHSFYLLFISLTFSFISGCSSTAEVKNMAKASTLFSDNDFTLVAIPDTASIFELPEDMANSIRKDYARSAGIAGEKMPVNKWLAEYIDAQNGGF